MPSVINVKNCRSFLARTVSYFLFKGCSKSLGVLLDGAVQFTDSNVTMVSWSFMTLQGVAFFVGPLTSFLMDYFSTRLLGGISGFMIGAGFLCQAFIADEVWKLFIVNIISGAGFGSLLLMHTVGIADVFGEKYGTVLSISTVIATVGSICMPLLLDHWLQAYGLSAATALLGALTWNSIPCGLASIESERGDVPDTVNNDNIGSDTSNRESTAPTARRNLFLAHPVLVFEILMRLLNFIIISSWSLYLVSIGVSKGYSPSTAVFLSSAGGAGLVLGKVLSVVVFYFEWMHNFPLLMSLAIGQVPVIMVYSLTDNFVYLLVASFITGTITSFYSAWVNVQINYIVCSKHFRSAMAWSNLVAGIGVISAGVISGLVHDIRGSFEDVFIFLSMLAVLQGCCSIPSILWVTTPSDC